MEDPIVYTKTDKHWDYGLLKNLAAGVSKDPYTEYTGKKNIHFKTLWVSRGNKKKEKIFKTGGEHRIIEVRFYSSDVENEAYRVGQKRVAGRISDVWRVDNYTNSGFIIKIDSSIEKNAIINILSLDRDYLENIGAKRIYFYIIDPTDKTNGLNVPSKAISVSVSDWLSSKTYIDNNIVADPDTSEDKLLEFDIGDYVEIEYAVGIHYSETEDFKIESIDTKKIKGKLVDIIPVTLQVIPMEFGTSKGHVRPSDFQAAGASLKEKIELTVYEYKLDVSQWHLAKYFNIQSYLIKTIKQVDPPGLPLDDSIKDKNLRLLLREQLSLSDEEPLTRILLETIDTLDCSNKNITTLTGIGLCSNLVTLNCSHNNLTAIDNLPQLESLQYLDCSYNNITGLNLEGKQNSDGTHCTRWLQYVDCRYNDIKSKDEIRIGANNIKLVIDTNVMYTPQKIYVKNAFDQTIYQEICTQLDYPINYKYLDTMDCEKITSLNLDGKDFKNWYDKPTESNKNSKNKIESLNGIEYLVNLTELIVSNNNIKKLNVQNNTKLIRIDVSYNRLTYNNTIVENGKSCVIDLSKLTELRYFDCRYNFIESEEYILKPPKVMGYDENDDKCLVESITNFKFYPQIENITYKFTCEKFKKAIRDALELEFDDMILKSDLIEITELNISNKGITSLNGIEYFVNLERLNCNDNDIRDIEVIFSGRDSTNVESENNLCPNLQWLECQNNKISNLRLYDLPKLEYVDCSENQLTILDIINCPNLQQLKCNNNKLATLTIGLDNDTSGLKYDRLLELDCSYNNLSFLELPMYPELIKLYCQYNKLIYIDINQCHKLQYFDCGFNLLETLRVDKCTELQQLKVNNNKLEELDLGMCVNLSSADVTYNYIKDISHVTNSIPTLIFYPQMINITKVFDDNLLTIIRKILNKEDNESIWNYDCLVITKLNINNKNINTLNGIEYFVNLEELDCSHNNLKILDLNSNTKLRVVYCDNNSLESMNISNCTELQELKVNNNKLESININGLVLLNTLYIGYNKLNKLDVSSCKELIDFNCENNKLKTLSIDTITSLKKLDCKDNELSLLNVSSNIYLEELDCQNNYIQTFDPRGRINLIKLNCSNNIIRELCVKSCLSLAWLDCSYNILTELDLSNRDKLEFLNCSYNSMISLDKLIYEKNNYLTGNRFIFNPQITDVTEEFTDINFRNEVRRVLGLTIDDPIMYSSCADITILDVSGKSISDLHGIEYFVNLEELDCHDNVLWNIDVSKNELLHTLYCSYNYMVTLNDIKRLKHILLDENIDFTPQNLIITDYFKDPVFESYVRGLLEISDTDPIIDQQCLKIEEVIVPHMDIHYLDGIEWFANITRLDCSYNLLESLDVTNCTKLLYINCSYNHIDELDIRRCENIEDLYCSHNNMTSTNDVHRNKLIYTIVDDTGKEVEMESELLREFEFDNQNVMINDEFTDFLFKSKVISLNDFVHNEVLTDYVASRITKLDLNSRGVEEDYKYKNLIGINWFVNLEELDCSYNMIEQLDVTGCVSLKKLNCSHNWIYDSFLNIHNHTYKCDEEVGYMETCTCKLEELDCSYNYMKSITVSYFKNLIYLNCSYNNTSLTSLNIINCTNLIKLDCSHNKLISLDCSGDINLRQLYCNHNNISRLELDDCIALEELYCYNNQLSRMIVDKCISLVYLYCYYNRIVVLDITDNKQITQLDCRNNQLTKLTISNSESLEYVYCHYNNLIDLDLNGCTNIEFLNCSYNSIRYITLITNVPDTLIEDDNFIYAPQNSY